MIRTMTDADIVRKLLFYGSGVLDEQLPQPLRAYSFCFDRDKHVVRVKAEVDRMLTEDEREDLSVAETELIAADLLGQVRHGRGTEVETLVSVIPADEPLDPLPRGIAFLRAGELAPEGYEGALPHPDAIIPRPRPNSM